MRSTKRGIAVAVALTLFAAGSAWAQTSQCTNNLKQIGIGVYNSPVKAEFKVEPGVKVEHPGAMVRGPHTVALCSDGTSKTLMLSERPAAASVRGCPADLDDRGFGEARVQARERPDGALEVTLLSHAHRGCAATAVFANSQFGGPPGAAAVSPSAGARPAIAAAGPREPDARRVSAGTRQAFASFWSGLPARESDALERRLAALEARAQQGASVDREIAAIRADHPSLFEAARRLEDEPWVLVGPGGVEEGVECKGIGWIGKNGKIRCIGHLVVSD